MLHVFSSWGRPPTARRRYIFQVYMDHSRHEEGYRGHARLVQTKLSVLRRLHIRDEHVLPALALHQHNDDAMLDDVRPGSELTRPHGLRHQLAHVVWGAYDGPRQNRKTTNNKRRYNVDKQGGDQLPHFLLPWPVFADDGVKVLEIDGRARKYVPWAWSRILTYKWEEEAI